MLWDVKYNTKTQVNTNASLSALGERSALNRVGTGCELSVPGWHFLKGALDLKTSRWIKSTLTPDICVCSEGRRLHYCPCAGPQIRDAVPARTVGSRGRVGRGGARWAPGGVRGGGAPAGLRAECRALQAAVPLCRGAIAPKGVSLPTLWHRLLLTGPRGSPLLKGRVTRPHLLFCSYHQHRHG